MRFFWSESSEAADVSILNEFKTAPFEKKLELARRHAKRGGGVKEEIVQRLLEELGRLAQGPAADALEIVFLLEELQGLPAAAVSPTESILRGPEAAKAIVQVRDRRYREKIYTDLPRLRPEDWPAVAREAFFDEPDFRLMSFLYELIREQGPERAAEKLVADAVFSPRKSPARVRVGCEKCAFSSGIARSDQPQPDLEDSGFARRPGVQGIKGTASRAIRSRGRRLRRVRKVRP